jgi:nucleotide-binding universal stress UspA family protein
MTVAVDSPAAMSDARIEQRALLRSEQPPADITLVVRGRAVCDYAAEHGFDLLVLGRHGDGGVLHHRLGHVAEAAARAGKLPVLLLDGR